VQELAEEIDKSLDGVVDQRFIRFAKTDLVERNYSVAQ
jgi:hypothetical protein